MFVFFVCLVLLCDVFVVVVCVLFSLLLLVILFHLFVMVVVCFLSFGLLCFVCIARCLGLCSFFLKSQKACLLVVFVVAVLVFCVCY